MHDFQDWSVAGPELVPAKKYCPKAIEDYAKLGNSKPPPTLLMDVRQHLSFYGWKIECTVFKPCPSSLRYRYTCPLTGKVYSSLLQLCRDLNKSSSFERETHMPVTLSRTEESLEMDDVCHYGGNILLCDGCPSSFHQYCLNLEEIPPGKYYCFMCCCYICGEFESDSICFRGGLVCSQCQRKYHEVCAVESRIYPGFCSRKCKEINAGLQRLESPITKDAGLTWRVIKCSRNKLNLPKLDEAIELVQECFSPVKDVITGVDMVESIFHGIGSHLKRVDFRSFYAILLEKDGFLLSTAALRILGAEVAELPFIASASSTLDTWIQKFGFSHIQDGSHLLPSLFLKFQSTRGQCWGRGKAC